METEPYSIYVNHRPFRVAFLVNPLEPKDWIEKIFNYNREKWGGRFNPIILTDGQTFKEEWWKLLRDYNPDIVYSTIPLGDEVKKKIRIFLSPLKVEESGSRREANYISFDDRPISVLPTGKNVQRIAHNWFDDKSKLVFFEVDASTPEVIKNFLDKNFGFLEQGRMMTYQMKKALETCEIKKYTITDANSLNSALLDLGDFHNRVVFPAQICALPNSFKEAEYNYNNERFEIVIGDSVDEITYFWNRTLAMGAWLRTSFTQIWLSKALIDEPIIRPGLEKFINRYTGITGNNNYHGAHFVTFSLTAEEIKAITDSFNRTIHHTRTSALLEKHPMPKYQDRASIFFLRRGLDFHRAHSNEEYLVLDEPDVEEGVMGGEHWFVDLFIQYRSENFKNIQGRDYWWQLPRRNSILRNIKFFDKEARINEFGMFSILMRRHTSMTPDDNILTVNIPEDTSVMWSLFCGESYDCYDRDERVRFDSRPFHYAQQSDKGMYLTGVVSLFPSLYSAHHLFEEKYWREVFERMSNHKPEKDESVLKQISNAIQKKISRGINLRDSGGVNWLANSVVNYAKQYSKEEIDLDYNELSLLAQKETDAYNTNPSGQTINFDEKYFKEKISYLVESNILLLGVKPRCPRCGYRIWYHIDNVHQKVICKGCNYEFSLPAEESWFYRLNSLVRAAVTLHGTVPLLLSLGQMAIFDARTCFITIPCPELLKRGAESNGGGYITDSEIDLACIKDGQFIIGEIKQSCDLFHSNDFSKILKVARLVRPDLIVFSSMDKKPNSFVTDNITKLQEELKDLEIKVEWYPINYWVFDSRPVR